MHFRTKALTLAGIVGISAASSASAAVTVSDPFFTISASAGAFSGSYSIPLSDPSIQFNGDPDMDFWYYNAPVPVAITSGANQIAQLVSLTVIVYRNTQIEPVSDVDPTLVTRTYYGVGMDFHVNAGTLGATTFTLASPVLGFDPILGGEMTGHGTRGGTDLNTNGIRLAPALVSGFGLNHTYNGTTTFANYFDTDLINGPSQSVTESGNLSPIGAFLPTVGAVTSLQTTFGFNVSSGDTATGTSGFAVRIPTPGSAALAAISGGFLLANRRRRR